MNTIKKKTRKSVNGTLYNSVPLLTSRVDPSKTTTLRRSFQNEITKRFTLFRKHILDLLKKEDAFGLVRNTDPFSVTDFYSDFLTLNTTSTFDIFNQIPEGEKQDFKRVEHRYLVDDIGPVVYALKLHGPIREYNCKTLYLDYHLPTWSVRKDITEEVPKCRLRQYDNGANYLEEKYTKDGIKYKNRTRLDLVEVLEDFVPIGITQYKRIEFENEDYRVTVDRDIRINGEPFPRYIVEVKGEIPPWLPLPMEAIGFSKSTEILKQARDIDISFQRHKPKLFLDIDGVLLTKHQAQGMVPYKHGDETFWYDSSTPERLRKLEKLFDIYWASHTWNPRKEELDKLFGLSNTYVAEFNLRDKEFKTDMYPEKLQRIEELANGPVVIVDDKMGEGPLDWSKGKFVLLIQPDKRVGLTEVEFNTICSFGKMLQSGWKNLVQSQLIQNEAHSYASTQINLPEVSNEVKTLQERLDPQDVLELEEVPHVTIRYGLHHEAHQPVEGLAAGSGPIQIKLGRLSVFTSPEQDVLKIEVSSPRLHDLNRRLKMLPHTDRFNQYNPHLTIAYLKSGTGHKYTDIPNPLNGKEFLCTKFVFSDKERNHTQLSFNTRWAWQTSLQKLDSFADWLREQLDGIILQPEKEEGKEAWWQNYIEQGYRRGAKHAWDEINKKTKIDTALGESMKAQFGRIVPLEKVQLLASRMFTGLKGITHEMDMRITRALTDGITRGEGPMEIARAISSAVDMGRDRAKLLARTETIYDHAEGVLDGLEKLGVTHVVAGVEWSTAGDNKICPRCAPLEGIIFTIQEARGLIPRHPNCITGDMPVICPSAKAIMRSSFTGEIFDITIPGGRRISVTGNHIVLTQRGWVFAKSLTDSDYLVDCSNSDFFPHCIDHNQDIATISEIFTSLTKMASKFATMKTLPMPHYLHGDGKFLDSEIEIININRVLWDYFQTNVFTQIKEGFLESRNIRTFNSLFLDRFGSLSTFLSSCSSTADSLVSCLGISDILFARSIFHHESVSFNPRSGPDVFSFKQPLDPFSLNLEFIGQRGNTMTLEKQTNNLSLELFGSGNRWGRVGTDDETFTSDQFCNGTSRLSNDFSDSVRTDSFQVKLQNLLSGKLQPIISILVRHVRNLPVYDVSTEDSAYLVNNIVTSNCRCTWRPASFYDKPTPRAIVQSALETSIRGERKTKKSLAKAKRLSSWIGTKLVKNRLVLHGGPGSGFKGHAGRPGEVGGSQPQLFKHPLFEKIVQGDKSALNELLQSHRSELLKFIRSRIKDRLQRRISPSDVAQEVMIKAMKKIDHFIKNPKIPFDAWLRHIARAEIIDTYRKAGRHIRKISREEYGRQQQIPDIQIRPDIKASRREFEDKVWSAVKQLNPRDQAIISWRYQEGLETEEIARRLGIDRNAADVGYHRAMKRLREAMGIEAGDEEILHNVLTLHGGRGSGFHGHSGRPGHVGGSAPSGSSIPSSLNPLLESLFQEMRAREKENSVSISEDGGPTDAWLKAQEGTVDYKYPGTESRHLLSTEGISTVEHLEGSPKHLNPVFKVTLNNGVIGIFKPAADQEAYSLGQRSGIREQFAEREVAASEINDILGLHLVPLTILREVEGDVGSFQLFAHNSENAWEFPINKMFDGPKQEALAGAFDYLIGHADRHSNNWRLPLDRENKIYLIDNGLSFPQRNDKGIALHEKHRYTLLNARILHHLAQTHTRIPREVANWANRWPEIENALMSLSLRRSAIDATKERLEVISSMAGQHTFEDLRELGPINWVRKFRRDNKSTGDI